MSDISAFLNARIDEDESIARSVDSGWPWRHGADDAGKSVVIGTRKVGNIQPYDAAHITHYDPTRALSECAAKRRIVQLVICGACEVEMQPCDHRDETLRALAAVYAEHPDYREEWRPNE